MLFDSSYLKIPKRLNTYPLPRSVVIYHILEVTAAYYNMEMLTSQLENADDKDLSGQVEKADISIEQENVLAAMMS